MLTNETVAVAAKEVPAMSGSSSPAENAGKIIPMNDSVSPSIPNWVDGDDGIMEELFCQWYLKDHPMQCYDTHLYDVDGIVNEEILKQNILQCIAPYQQSAVIKKVKALIECLKTIAYQQAPLPSDRLIHLSNGTYEIGVGFDAHKEIVRNRIPVPYNADAPEPTLWKKFLSDLFEEEDIVTFRQYCGYVLTQHNRAQRALFVIGNGGEGKSQIGIILQALLGDNCVPGKISKLESSRFALSSLEGKQLMIDDDMKMLGLDSTECIKSLITAAAPMSIERKFEHERAVMLYTKLIGFGNATPTALHDRSDGFFRRQIVLTTKRRDPNRVDDPYLADKLKKELPSILKWALEGLEDLFSKDYHFTISEKTLNAMSEAQEEQNTALLFLKSDWVKYDPSSSATTAELIVAYADYCKHNGFGNPLKEKTFTHQLSANADQFNIQPSKNLKVQGKKVRGYKGLRVSGSYTAVQTGYQPGYTVGSTPVVEDDDDDPFPPSLDEEMADLKGSGEDDADDILAELNVKTTDA